MDDTRRDFIRTVGALAAMGAWATPAAAQQAGGARPAFETKSLADTVKALGGSGAPAESKEISIEAPEIAENGAVVPIGVDSKVPGTQAVYILVDKNPNMLAAGFTIPQGTDARVTTRIKMGQTSNVMALVKANDKFFVASKEVKVTLGGCGG